MPLIPPAAKIPLPIQETLGEHFVKMLGKGASASKAKELKVKVGADAPRLVVAVWTDRHDRVAALCISELRLAAITGSALGMIPAATLSEIDPNAPLRQDLMENYYEVVNMTTPVLQKVQGTPRLKLAEMYTHPNDELPQSVWDIINSAGQRRDFDLTVEGYGSGKISILTR